MYAWRGSMGVAVHDNSRSVAVRALSKGSFCERTSGVVLLHSKRMKFCEPSLSSPCLSMSGGVLDTLRGMIRQRWLGGAVIWGAQNLAKRVLTPKVLLKAWKVSRARLMAGTIELIHGGAPRI